MRLGLMTILLGYFLSAVGAIAFPASNEKQVALTQAERDWIAQQPPLRAGMTTAYPPFSYRDPTGKLAGVDVDILNLISERTGLKFKIVDRSSWEKVAKLALDNQLDFCSGVAQTPERLEKFSFTRPYSDSPVVIVGQEGDYRFQHISLLSEARIAMPRQHSVTAALAKRLPSARVILADTPAECFKLVEQKKADATIANLFVTTRYLNENPGSGLMICGVVREFSFPIRLAAARDKGPLLDILDNALATISLEEMDRILSKHLLFELQGGQRIEFLQQWMGKIVAGCLLVVALLLLWNFLVRKEVRARRLAEAELRKVNDELREANQETKVFAYSLSHDLKGPLRAISGFAEILKEDYQDKLDPEGQENLDRVISGASRMSNLIRDILLYSRASHSETTLQTIPLNSMVPQLINEFPPEQRKCFEIVSPLPEVKGDPTLLSQCIANLLANAVKFVPNDRVPKIRIRAESEDSIVKLWVEDNGIGIAPEDRERIFKIFERAAPSDYDGTGIGLAIVTKAIKQMEGTVGVESEFGKGSRFWIRLHAAGKEKPAAKSGHTRFFRRQPVPS